MLPIRPQYDLLQEQELRMRHREIFCIEDDRPLSDGVRERAPICPVCLGAAHEFSCVVGLPWKDAKRRVWSGHYPLVSRATGLVIGAVPLAPGTPAERDLRFSSIWDEKSEMYWGGMTWGTRSH